MAKVTKADKIAAEKFAKGEGYSIKKTPTEYYNAYEAFILGCYHVRSTLKKKTRTKKTSS